MFTGISKSLPKYLFTDFLSITETHQGVSRLRKASFLLLMRLTAEHLPSTGGGGGRGVQRWFLLHLPGLTLTLWSPLELVVSTRSTHSDASS